MADTASLDIPEDLAQVAQEKSIPLELVRRAMALGFPVEAIKMQMSQPGVTAEAAEQFIAEQEKIRGAGGEISVPPELKAVADAEHEFNTRYQIVSTCEFRMPPKVGVVGGSCQAQ